MKIITLHQLNEYHQPHADWIQAHCGNVSGSYLKAVLDFTKKGEPSATRKTYLWQKVAERVSGIAISDHYVSREMLDGLEREEDGKSAYELENDCLLDSVGFCLHDSAPRFGCSPDGLIGKDGGLELKCPKLSTHCRWIDEGVIPEEHRPQMESGISVCGWQWCDFASFHPAAPRAMRLFCIRMERDEQRIAEIEDAVRKFNAEVDAAIDRIRKRCGVNFPLPAQVAAQVVKEAREDPDAHLGELTNEDWDAVMRQSD